MPHGMDQLFGLRRREFDPQVLPAMSGLAARAFMETRDGRRLYLNRMAQLHTNVFDVPALTATVGRMEALLRPALRSDPDALAEFDARVPFLRERLADRHAEIGEQLAEMRTPRFDAKGEVSLAGFNFRSTFRERSYRRRGRMQPEFADQDYGRTFGSWRAIVLLEGGQYRLQARVRMQLDQRAISPETVSLRSSEGRTLKRMEAGKGWAVIEHDFVLRDQNYVDLIYEFSTADGSGALDKSSLKLIRLPDAAATRPNTPGTGSMLR